ncbi:MAG: hypothetical protein CMH47_10680 [Muricauda sp.]|nr:hypothetical protein [Allomuricauda sp.]
MCHEQIARLKKKLQQAKERDALYKVFGAGSHRYHLNAPEVFLKLMLLKNIMEYNFPIVIGHSCSI